MSKRILVIDDERAVRDAFQLALEDEGYDIETAEDGVDGLEKVRQRRPDLIFLDLKMPRMNGVETLKGVKEIDATIPVYIVTAFQREFMAPLSDAAAAGLEFELAAKPLTEQQIISIAKTKLG